MLGKLVEAGLEDVRVGVVSPVCNRSDMQPDFWVMDKNPWGFCYPFSRDGLTAKTYASIYARSNTAGANRAKGLLLRGEIRRAVQEMMNAHSGIAVSRT